MPVIPWDDVETLVKAGMAVQQVAEKLGMPDQFERIKRQVTRKGWISKQTDLDTAIEQVKTVKATLCPNVPSLSQVMDKLSPESKLKGAIALNNGLEYFARLDGEAVAERADKFKALVSTGTPIHGWDKDSKAQLNLSFTLHAGSPPPDAIDV